MQIEIEEVENTVAIELRRVDSHLEFRHADEAKEVGRAQVRILGAIALMQCQILREILSWREERVGSDSAMLDHIDVTAIVRHVGGVITASGHDDG